MSRSPAAPHQGSGRRADPEPLLDPGTLFADRFEIVRLLGRGGMGTVYLARHRAMDRPCAVKLLHPALGRDAEARARFAREARNASRIAHPGVCAIYDFGETTDGAVYLVMEYADGRSLGSLLAESGSLGLARTTGLVQAIADALDAAHTLGIVHRDLKPDNVIVLDADGTPCVKLVDFGIAKAIEPELRGDVTADGVVVGTPDYMAPEQFAGDPVDHRCDIYALGLIACRMLTGTLPFKADSARASLSRRLTDPAEPLSILAPGQAFPDGLQAVIDRALARRPGDRFDRATEFADALGTALADAAAVEGDARTLRLDRPTTSVTERGRPGVSARRLVLPIFVVIAAAAGGAVVLKDRLAAPAGDRTGSPPGGQGELVDPAGSANAPVPVPAQQTERPGAPPREREAGRAPVQSGSVPPALPTLPDPATILDPETRGASRASAEHIYRLPEAEPVVRAQAAFLVATAYGEDGRYADAVRWAQQALTMNERAPSGTDRDDRRDRYQAFLRQMRLKLEEPGIRE